MGLGKMLHVTFWGIKQLRSEVIGEDGGNDCMYDHLRGSNVSQLVDIKQFTC